MTLPPDLPDSVHAPNPEADTVGREGLILVNVLFIVALAAIVVMLMMASQTEAIDRTVRLREAAQAAAIARAGELSAVAALRRDAINAPETDNTSEPWAAIQDRDAMIEGGTFGLILIDDQARFNLNTLTGGSLVAEDRLMKILVAAGLRPALRDAILVAVRFQGRLSSLDQLADVGMTPSEIARLGELATVLPADTSINLNTADERLLAVLFDSPVIGRLLASARRSRRGVLTPQDLSSLNAIPPPGVGFTSAFYRVYTEVAVGDTRQGLESRLMRRSGANGPEVVVYARRRTAAEPVKAPPRR